jgi:TetR/AcrR family transcriptional regulator, lmrAB and yxaGH operons repressor
MIEAAADLIRTRGFHDASFTEVLDASGAARGAIYHHFPGGKEELAREAVLLSQRQFLERLRQGQNDSPDAVLDTFLGILRELVLSDGGPGCAAGAVVQDAGGGPGLAAAADGTFRAWVAAITAEFVGTGMPEPAAESFATLMIAALEGVHLLCRAAGGPEPFEAVARSLRLSLSALTAQRT